MSCLQLGLGQATPTTLHADLRWEPWWITWGRIRVPLTQFVGLFAGRSASGHSIRALIQNKPDNDSVIDLTFGGR